MSGTDFVDDDLTRHRELSKATELIRPTPTQPDADPAQSVLAQRRGEVEEKMAGAVDELERLRRRQEALEREKAVLEQLRSNQDRYEKGKRELIERLEESLVGIEREDTRLHQRMELLEETDKRFKSMLEELRAMREETWPADSVGFREEMARALIVLDNMRKEFNKAYARLEALRQDDEQAEEKGGIFVGNEPELLAEKGFLFWLKIGLAFSLPVLIGLLVLAVVLLINR